MKHQLYISGIVLSVLLGLFCAGSALESYPVASQLNPTSFTTTSISGCFAAAPRWWDDTVQWVRSLGWDRSRLVQVWLFFMLIGLYIILRIKPRG